jgi:transposase-like protein
MRGKQPRSIITDQDKAMKSAVAQVLPDSRHRNCFFHIKQKCYNKNLKVFAKNNGLPEMFEDTVNFSVTEEEFETLWQTMIAEFKLENNKYLSKVWDNRERFIPVYYKNDFFPFIQSTRRSEGTNARFKDNVGPTYSLVSFLREYQRIVDVIRNK